MRNYAIKYLEEDFVMQIYIDKRFKFQLLDYLNQGWDFITAIINPIHIDDLVVINLSPRIDDENIAKITKWLDGLPLL